ncbi:MAG: hypothetical protein AB7K09_12855 [Planctomycetota bacterium]
MLTPHAPPLIGLLLAYPLLPWWVRELCRAWRRRRTRVLIIVVIGAHAGMYAATYELASMASEALRRFSMVWPGTDQRLVLGLALEVVLALAWAAVVVALVAPRKGPRFARWKVREMPEQSEQPEQPEQSAEPEIVE